MQWLSSMSVQCANMRCIEISQPGGPEVLTLAQRPVPEPNQGEVLIKVAAAGVNRPDVFQRLGRYPAPPGASDIPGLEVAGEIIALGSDVPSRRLGERVCALVTGGGYAEYCIAPSALALPIPQGMSDVQAAALPETYFTVWSNVFDRGQLQVGESLLVHGGASGIGTTAIQMAKALGAKVFATVSSDEKVKVCSELGADLVINYQQQDFVATVLQATEGHGIDVILDMVGGDYIARNLETLAVEGRLVQIAFLRGAKAQIDFRLVMQKRLSITGSTLRARSVEAKLKIATSLQKHIWPLLVSRTIKPYIYREYPLAQAAAAHQLMESNLHIGKIMLTMNKP